ncbi:hypothetical protein SAMN05443549_103168 [Flavobacterium fluvii]|uniref:CDP-Glycerol:Poly(Glycerophosphate) glycerophosphotransferase n=1 Tax=Flavobacterium fluvii TaxID=468056 RepID=A0A1M5IPK8_9FLAO|nr:hypothetical protein [Flavobacterium fluvii]SHG29713.1 hypothetical protein SAMN05443549_103168 [Flavobacterium fluvii]
MINDFLTPYLKIRKGSSINLVNETKFLQVVTFWFNYFDFANDFFLSQKKDLNLLNNDLIRKSIFHFLDVYDGKCGIILDENIKFHHKIAAFFLFGKKGYLPSGVSANLSDKIKFKLLFYKVNILKIKIDSKFKDDYFEECYSSFGIETVSVLRWIIPDVFFASGLSSDNNLPHILKGSPLCFFDFNYNYLKLLLQSEKVQIIGFQHGGVYGEWKNNPYEIYEKSISDFYYGWGFFENNIIQNRFKKLKNFFPEKEGIFWFGRDECYLSSTVDFGNSILSHFKEVDHLEFFYKFFKKFNFKFLPHPRNGSVVYEKIINQSFYDSTNDSANYVLNAKLVLFDCLSHTLLYHCLFNEIPFLIFLNKWPTELSEKASDFYTVLHENNLLLIKGDLNIENKLASISEYLNGNIESLYSKDFNDYIKKVFFSHKTIDLI